MTIYSVLLNRVSVSIVYTIYYYYIRYTISCIVYRVSCIVYRVSCIVYRVSCIVYRVSCIVYRVSCVRCVVRGVRCVVRGAWCAVRGAWCVVRGAWCVVRGAWCVGVPPNDKHVCPHPGNVILPTGRGSSRKSRAPAHPLTRSPTHPRGVIFSWSDQATALHTSGAAAHVRCSCT